MKVIIKDNLGRENVSDRILIPLVTRDEGEYIAEVFNRVYGGELSARYYKCVDDDYKLCEFEGY